MRYYNPQQAQMMQPNPRNAGRPAPGLNTRPSFVRDINTMPQGMNMQPRGNVVGLSGDAQQAAQQALFTRPMAAQQAQQVAQQAFPNPIMGQGSPGRRNVGAGSPGRRPRGDGRINPMINNVFNRISPVVK